MIPTLSLRTFCAVLLVVPILCVFGMAAPDGGYTQKSVGELIDDLTQIDSQSPGISSAAIYEGFIADNSPGSFHGGVLGIAPPKVPPQMSELVRRGPFALPELIKHLDDRRTTRLEGAQVTGFGVINAAMCVVTGSLLSAMRRTQISRSVTMPSRVFDTRSATTGTEPISCRFIRATTLWAV
jgi:hypothetical protein